MGEETETEKVVSMKPTQQLSGDLHPRFPKLTVGLLLGALAQAGPVCWNSFGMCGFLNSTACRILTDV